MSDVPVGAAAHVTTTNDRRRIRTLGMAMIHTLLLQLLVGMANTFWLTLPDSGSGWASAAPTALLMAHIALGLLLLVLAIWIAASAASSRDRTWLTASAIGILGIVVAFASGLMFMADVSSDGASFVMAVGCVLAIGGYASALGRDPATSGPAGE